MKLALANTSLPGLSFESVCETARELGFRGLLLSPASISPQNDASRLGPGYGEYLLEAAQFHDLTIVGFQNLLDDTENIDPGPFSLVTADSDTQERTRLYLNHLAEICYAMEGQTMILGSARERNLDQNGALDEAAQHLATTVANLAEICAPCGITIALDPIPYTETNLLTSAREASILQKFIAHPSSRLQLNTRALAKELNPQTPGTPTPSGVVPTDQQIGQYARDLIHFHRERLAHFQIEASTTLNLRPYLLALHEIDYRGWVSVQVPAEAENPQKHIVRTLTEFRKLNSANSC
jgi:sugar phosphate isomerase/epimerase